MFSTNDQGAIGALTGLRQAGATGKVKVVRYVAVDERALLAPALAKLPPREQSILRMRFVQGLTQSEIALSIGVSQMHVSRLLASSLEELRHHIGADTAD